MISSFDNLSNKKILVTGGAGFIGSNLCEKLLELGAVVTCLDNFSTGFEKNVKNLFENPNFKLIKGDIRDYETCLLATKNQDLISHQAALGSVPRSIKDPITSNEVNVNGSVNLFFAAKKNNISRIIFAASSSTYGDSKLLPKVEHKIGSPLSPYGLTKYINELYAEIFYKTYNINYIGLRYFNVFGKNQTPDGPYAAVIPLFIKKLINHDSPVINGKGNFSRDFTYIKNVVNMNILALSTTNKASLNNIYNTACGEQISLTKMFNVIKTELTKYDKSIDYIEAKYGPEREGDIPHSLACIKKAKKYLSYSPKYSFNEGIREAIDWYFKNLKNAN